MLAETSTESIRVSGEVGAELMAKIEWLYTDGLAYGLLGPSVESELTAPGSDLR